MAGKTRFLILYCMRGATVVEYAIVLPVLLLLIMGVVEYDTMMYATAVLEGSTISAAREGATGYTASGFTRQQFIYNMVQNRVQALLNPASLTISSKSYAAYADIGKPEPCITHSPCPGTPGVNFVDVNGNGTWDQDQGAAGLGGAGDIVVYTVTYPWNIYTPFLRPFLGTNGVFTISSSSVVKNEPYTASSTR